MTPRRTLIAGAAGRDFHNFNVAFRGRDDVRVIAFTATQIPDIEGRVYPAELAGEGYPDGIPIRAEDELADIVRSEDIDDVVFCDVPWLLAKPDSPVKADVERLWPARTAQYARFYAMGADAYNVIPFLNNLKKYPYERFNGQTGVLQLADGNQIVRQLQWARFSNGLARPLN